VADDDLPFSELLARAKDGDAEARSHLFDRLAAEDEGAWLLAQARRILPRGDLARDLVESQDLVQSALRSGWSELGSFRGESTGEFMNWLRTILRRKLSRRTRKNTPRVGRAEPVEPLDREELEDDPEGLEAAVREETLRRLQDAVAQLPPDQRIVLERRLHGVTSKDIAAELGLEPATVRKRESRAVARLRGLFEDDVDHTTS